MSGREFVCVGGMATEGGRVPIRTFLTSSGVLKAQATHTPSAIWEKLFLDSYKTSETSGKQCCGVASILF